MRALLFLFLAALVVPATFAKNLELTLQTRDPVTGQIHRTIEMVDPKHIGVIAVDVWIGLAGADENPVSISNGSNLAKYPSVIFKIFIDGQPAAASPVMRILSPAWRFDVKIPAGARIVSLVAMDAGGGSREDFADWANAGFVVNR